MGEIKLLIEISLVISVLLVIFVVQHQYNFTVQWNKKANRYNLIWEVYTLQQEYKQKTIRLWKVFNIFRYGRKDKTV